MDFNVRNMSAIIVVQRKGVGYAVDELTGVLDTPRMIELIKDRFHGCSIRITPDASGQNTSSKSASLTDISLLKEAGLYVDAPKKNPFIKDRVNSVNGALEKEKIKVNKEKCPQLDLALQQQIYDKNGMPEKRQDDNKDDILDALGYIINRLYPINNYRVSGVARNWK